MSAINTFEFFNNQDSHALNLRRFPDNKLDKSLRAWDAADEYLISTISQTYAASEINHISIINDSFGCLSCALSILYPFATIYSFSDSFMSLEGARRNLASNGIDTSNIHFLDSLDLQHLTKYEADLIVLKIPRTHAYLDYIIACVSRAMAINNSMFLSGAMVKMISSSVLKLFNAYFCDTKTTLAKKKARLVVANTVVDDLAQRPFEVTKTIKDNDISFTLTNFPNVFCRDQIDIGARLFMQHLPTLKGGQTIIDLGCGNGVLGLSIIKHYVQTNTEQNGLPPKVIFIDESYMAIASVKASCVDIINSTYSELAEFHVDHCLLQFLSDDNNRNSIDKIVCNPPFHQQSSTLDDIAWQMFLDSKKVLKRGGELLVVGNRHLNHRAKLAKLFGGCKIVATNNKFTVFSAIKM